MKFVDTELTVEEQHHNDIRETIWYRVKFDNEMIASNDALLLEADLLGATHVAAGRSESHVS